MKRPSILIPVIAGFGVILVLLLSVAVVNISHIGLISDRLTAIVSERNQKAELAATLHGLHQARFQSLLLAASQADPFRRDEELMAFAGMARDFIQVRERFLGLPLDDDERQFWNTVRGEVRQVEEKAARVVDTIYAGRLDEANRLIQAELAPHQQRMMTAWGRLLELQRARNRDALHEVRLTRIRARDLSVVLSLVAMLAGLAITVLVVRLSRRVEKELFDEKEQAQVTLFSIGDGVIRFDHDLRVGFLNPVAETMLGLTDREARNQPVQDILRLMDRQGRTDLAQPLCAEVLHGQHVELPATARLLSAQGVEYEVAGKCSPIHAPDGGIEGGVLVLRDVTEARELQRRLVWQADHDGLTGIFNRRAFEERVSKMLSSKRSREFPMSLLFIDLDHFKQVNDTAGHAAGDELLRQLSRLMQSRIREDDVLARLGGDEFAILLAACPGEFAEKIANLVREEIAGLQFVWEGRQHRVGASIGVVHVPPAWSTLDECLAAADAACYQAKRNGRNAIVVHGEVENPWNA